MVHKRDPFLKQLWSEITRKYNLFLMSILLLKNIVVICFFFELLGITRVNILFKSINMNTKLWLKLHLEGECFKCMRNIIIRAKCYFTRKHPFTTLKEIFWTENWQGEVHENSIWNFVVGVIFFSFIWVKTDLSAHKKILFI